MCGEGGEGREGRDGWLVGWLGSWFLKFLETLTLSYIKNGIPFDIPKTLIAPLAQKRH